MNGEYISVPKEIKIRTSLKSDRSQEEEKEWGLMDGLGLVSIGLASYVGSYLAETIGFGYLLRISSLGILLLTSIN